MLLTKNTNNNYTTRQLKLPLEIEKLIDISDPAYTFCEVVNHIDLTPYFAEDKDCKTYAKTDHDATFMRIKRDYMGNDQLLPAYNVQAAICDEYIAVIDAKPFASDQDCFVPLMEKFKNTYGHYPKYPVADAGYGSYNNFFNKPISL